MYSERKKVGFHCGTVPVQTKHRYTDPVRESVKAMLAWGWTLEQDQARFSSNRDSIKRRASKANIVIAPLLFFFLPC